MKKNSDFAVFCYEKGWFICLVQVKSQDMTSGTIANVCRDSLIKFRISENNRTVCG